MANNTQLPGTGTGTADIIVATEKITGVDYQKIKLIDATATSETPTGVAANPLVVTANLSATDNAVLDTIDAVLDLINAKLVTGTVIGDVNLGATDNAVLDTMVTALQLIDNMISGSEAQVDVITLPAVTIAAAQTLATVTTVGTVTTITTCNLAAETTKVIGTVRVASGGIASGGIASGAIASGAIAAGAVAAGAVVSGAVLSGAFASGSIVAGAVAAGATSFVKLEDVASADGEAGVCVFAIRDDTCDIRSATEGDFEYFHVDAVGRLWTNPQGNVAHDAADSGNPIKIGAIANAAEPAAVAENDRANIGCDLKGNLRNVGNVAHDSADSGNPIKIGGIVDLTPSTATIVADNDRCNAIFDSDGIQITRPHCTLGDCLVERVSNTDGASTASTVFGATAGTRNCITTIIVHNAHASTNGYVDIRDGTAGTVLMTIPLPANGGAVINLPIPIRTTANTALAFDVSAAITTVYLTFVGFKSKVA